MRSALSVLGITIGIFCIVTVLTFAGSMKRNVRNDLESLGLNVIFVEKWPWGGGGGEYRWWDFMSRPEAGWRDYKLMKDRCSPTVVKDVGYECSTSGQQIKFGKRSTNKSKIFGITANYTQMNGLNLLYGRVFTEQEQNSGKNVAVIGYELASQFFNEDNPVGQSIKINGYKTIVVGVFEKQGSLINKQADKGIYVPVTFMRNFTDINDDRGNSRLIVQGFESRSVDELESEIVKVMRGIRCLKPKEKNNFALNKMTLFSKQLDSTFVTLDIVAWILGLFSLLVGMFGIANIMFVSVKERTSIIGVQKALGAKNAFILNQFLYESIVLSLVGGLAGTVLVWITSMAISSGFDFPVYFTLRDFLTGIMLSTLTGILAGIIPAIRASKLDPVEAIRSQ